MTVVHWTRFICTKVKSCDPIAAQEKNEFEPRQMRTFLQTVLRNFSFSLSAADQ